MDLASLNAFIAIAEVGSFSRAGDRLHLTQPAISKRIASLEQQLGVRLFDRLGREVNLTEAGRALLPRAYQILDVLEDTRRALTNLSGDVTGRLTLATSHHIGLHRLPPLLRTYTRMYPKVALDIQFLDSEVAYEEILHGRAELAVITLAPEPHHLVRSVPVWHDLLDFVAAPEHPLALQDAVKLSDIAEHPAVFPGGNTFTHHIVSRLFEAQGLSPNTLAFRCGRHVVIGRGDVGVDAPWFAAGQSQPFERLGRSHFVDDVTVDVDQRRTIVALLDQMRIPELVVERFAGHQTFPHQCF